MNHILSAKQFDDVRLIEMIFSRVHELQIWDEAGVVPKVLAGKIIATIFFEPSTRTRLSFETAALKLGAQVISAENAMENSSTHKGETIEDTTKILCSYADLVVIRHPKEGSLEAAAKVATKPLINGGDGGNQHPTQALLDLYTIQKHMGRLDNLKVAFGFDPKHSRTIRSLALLLANYPNNHFTFVCPEALNPSPEFLEELKAKGATVELTSDLTKFKEYDIFYTNRLQEERFEDRNEFEKYRKELVITKETVGDSKTLIMDPLPRIDEIDSGVDDLPNAIYFDQAKNGLYIRMALLLYSLDL